MTRSAEPANLEDENRALRAEVARLRARLDERDGGAPRPRRPGGRSTPAGHDVLVSAVETTRTPMIVTDPNRPDDPIVFANRAFQELSGYSSEELVGRNCRFLQGPGTDPAGVQRVREAMRDGREVAVDLLNYRRDGTPFLNELHICPVLDEDGRVLYHFGSQVDVTGYREDRRRVETGEERQRAIFDSIIDVAIVVTDRDGRVTEWNTGAERVLGWSADAMRGRPADRIFTPEDRSAGWPEAEMRLALAQGRASDERWHLRADGARFWASGELMPLRDADGRHIGFVKVLRDRTDEHVAGRALAEAEARLRESEDHYRHTVELNPQVPWTCDPAGSITSYSQRWLDLTGQRPGEPDGAGWAEALHPDDLPRTMEHFAARLASGEPVDVDYRIRVAATGAYRWMRARAQPRRNEAGAILRWYGVVEDVHDRKRAEERLRASEERYRALFDAIDAGFCTFEMRFDEATGRAVDYRFLEVNAAFEAQTGLADAVGRWMRDLAPAHEQVWFDRYGEIALTGEPRRFEDEAAALGRYYDISAFRVGPPGAHQVAALFRDITARRRTELALRESEARYRTLFDSIDEGFCTIRFLDGPHGPMSDYVHVEANPAFEHHLGIPHVAGQTLRDIAPDEETGGWLAIYGEVLRTGRPVRVQREFVPTGRHLEVAAHRVEPESRREVAVLFTDVTARRRAEAALRESEERFRTILDTVEAAFAIVEVKFDADDRPVDYRFLEANPAFERQAGVDLRGKWVTEFAPDLERHWFETYGHVARTGEPATFESYAEAFKRWFDVKAVRVGKPDERRIAIFFSDVTARRAAEERLRLSEAVARENIERVGLALAAGAIIGTWHWDLPTDRFTVDEAFARSFGLDPALGREGIPLARIVDTVHPDDQAGLADAIAEAIARGGAYAHQYRTRRADGRYYWLEANGRVDHGPDGTPKSFPGVLIDVEERRAVEAERDRAAAALRALNETLESRVAARTAELMRAEEALRQSQKMEAVGQLTGGLAHDFNNLLAGVQGSLELMQTRMSQGRVKDVDRYLIAAQGAAKRAAALTHRLLAFSRRQTLDPRPTDVNALVSGMLDLIQRTVGPGIRVEAVALSGLWPALVDPSQLENALLNLCINARDAMPDGGRITIETANKWLDREASRAHDVPEGQYLSLCVTDTGTGMSPDVVAKAFDPFFTTKPIGQGTGLGLSMIYGFAKQSGGQVRIYSEVGQGTTVCLYLPRHYGEAADEAAGPTRAPIAFAQAGETVLIVDDEPTVRMLVTDVLEDLGYTAIEAADSAAGLKVLRSDVRVDLLVSDVGLPGGMNGRQMADAGREKRPDLKVLFITGYAENAAIGNGHLAPGMQVLTKPFAVDALAARIRELIAK